MKLPTVNIVIPVYNQEKYIQECVEGVLKQSYKNIEIIVVDDGSTDATPEILKKFREQIKYIRQDNQGPSSALNNGLRSAESIFVGWLGSDDIYLPDLVRIQVKKFQEDPSIALIYTDYILIDSEGKELRVVKCPSPPQEQFINKLLERNFINGSTVMMRRECFEKVGYYDEKLKASVDGDMWFRLLAHGYKFRHIAKPLVKYRMHPANLSHKFRLMQKYRDLVQLKALKVFLSHGISNDSKEFEQLSYNFVKQFSFNSAIEAMKKSIELKFSLKRSILCLVFRILNRSIFIKFIGLMKNIRGKIKDRHAKI